MKKFVGYLTYVLAFIIGLGGFLGGLGYMLAATAFAIVQVVNMVNGSEQVSFWTVFWLLVMLASRPLIAAIIMLICVCAAFLLGAFAQSQFK